ncbi:MAG: helix-turn-helix domain-containing protein [Clostridia bacterium]|nr:helix-turn-helix domain-containing protein [Clostridia bacterium]
MDRVNLFYPAVFRMTENGYSAFVPDFPEFSGFHEEEMEDLFYEISIELGFYFDNEPENPPEPSSFEEINETISSVNDFVMLVPVANTDEIIIGDDTNAGECIKEGLKKRNLTAAEAGKILGVSEDYINDMMTGKSMPSNPMAERMALLFDFDIGKFFELIKFEEEDDDEDE